MRGEGWDVAIAIDSAIVVTVTLTITIPITLTIAVGIAISLRLLLLIFDIPLAPKHHARIATSHGALRHNMPPRNMPLHPSIISLCGASFPTRDLVRG